MLEQACTFEVLYSTGALEDQIKFCLKVFGEVDWYCALYNNTTVDNCSGC